MNKASFGHTVDTSTSFFTQKHSYDKILTYLYGLRGPDFLQVAISPLRIFNSVDFGYGGGCRPQASRQSRR